MTAVQIRCSGVNVTRFHQGPTHDDVVKIHDLLSRGYTVAVIERGGHHRVVLNRNTITTNIATYEGSFPRPVTTRQPWVGDLIALMKAHDPTLTLEDQHGDQEADA